MARALVSFALLRLGVAQKRPYERFPLNGGLTNGVNIHIDGELGGPGDNVIEFIGYDRYKARNQWTSSQNSRYGTEDSLRFNMKQGDKMILREISVKVDHDNNDAPLEESFDFGGFPIKTRVVDLNFYKTPKGFQVTVEGVRLEWFDVDWPNHIPLNEVRISSGIQNPDVLLTRPECTESCSRGECRDRGGEYTSVNICQEDELSDCMSYEGWRGDGGKCVNVARTDYSFDAACCTGRRIPFEFDDSYRWVQVTEDKDYLAMACGPDAFNLPGCANFPGLYGRVNFFTRSADTVRMWFPSLDLDNQNNLVELPRVTVRPHAARGVKYLITFEQLSTNRGTRVDSDDFVVKYANTAQLLGKFVNMIHDASVGAENDPWRLYTANNWEGLPQSNGIWAMVTDVRAPPPTDMCTELTFADGSEWRDKRIPAVIGARHTCADYKENGWCTMSGKETAAWDSEKNGRTFREYEVEGLDAADVCCHCGGGTYGGTLDDPPSPLTFELIDGSLWDLKPDLNGQTQAQQAKVTM